MNKRRMPLVAVLSFATFTTGGCSLGAEETPGPPPPASTTNADAGPRIANPKKLSAIADPCQLLKPEQAEQLGTGNPQPGRLSGWGQPTCDWEVNNFVVSLAPETVQGKGISVAMKNESKTKPDSDVNGYPVVEAQTGRTTCGIVVGASSSEVLTVFTSVPSASGKKPCDLAKEAAGLAMMNLPTGT